MKEKEITLEMFFAQLVGGRPQDLIIEVIE